MKKIVLAVIAAVLAAAASEFTRRAIRRSGGSEPDALTAATQDSPKDLVFEAEPVPAG